MTGRRDFDRIHDELEELFTDLWRTPFAGLRHGYRPHVDCYLSEEPPAITVVVELPGVDPAEIELVVAGRTLIVSGERRRTASGCPVSYQQLEIEVGLFRRRIPLAADVDPDRAAAAYEAGLLTVVLPLTQQSPAEAVSIHLGGKR